jgi:hypothetical protein
MGIRKGEIRGILDEVLTVVMYLGFVFLVAVFLMR